MLSKEHFVSVGRQLLIGRKEEGNKPRVFTFSFQTCQSAHFPWRGVSKGIQGARGVMLEHFTWQQTPTLGKRSFSTPSWVMTHEA